MKKAFTLAEVLITVTVIGVVAVLAIFKVYSEYQKTMFKAQFKKEYNTITKATRHTFQYPSIPGTTLSGAALCQEAM